ncbi:hypothetical protein Saro_2035 [Novosphingobium aromaticivorans DSM 12444]|uniref:Uncharacterized protein n=1 Tax=Novosphingobium aromaticivorans (strain ATCC 700278 / DSM 12444 / CCUG 56034 / CIP 105152 / NBRC 16084 / F199) TaxID=279238 RepID=Q2G6P9_NOVAD|nr:hypothetical protein [Novosphingobium aromaticivorans]ABD26474.1 hypothetical protein Saro_2035 [Novosphingobium aromaticivorans DSM 12444]SCY77271.1 hypothetical protein SAMN05660666_02855 [Novosphingobium aromaticivorans]
MALTAPTGADHEAIEALLREELFRADEAIVHQGPILRYLLRNDDSSIFSDDVIARVRGMVDDIARQLIDALDEDEDAGEGDAFCSRLASHLCTDQSLLDHLHMLAVEWQLTEKLQGRLGLDPVLTPLLQELIAAPDPDVAARGMNLLAAQARFGQTVRRMQAPLIELPADLHAAALTALKATFGADPAAHAAVAAPQARLHAARVAHSSRLDLLAHAVEAVGGALPEALSVQNAGVALFLSGLGIAAGIPREAAVMCTTDGQRARLLLAMAAAGMARGNVVANFSAIHPDVSLPSDVDSVHPDRAAALLSASRIGARG